jgi:23S rRNA pseudouridine2605 synthase
MNSGERLNKFLAARLGIGRREADNLVAKGKVLVNGAVPILGARIQSSDRVEVDGKQVDTKTPEYTYILMNKPTGYVCSKRQQGDTLTIYSLLPPEYKNLKTVGRLDKDSSGLILLTNDGDFAHRLTHPSFVKIKKYEVTLDKPLSPNDLARVNNGVELPDGMSHLQTELLNQNSYAVTMHEGRNRQIRRTFTALGYNVTKLHRTQFGDYILGDLQSGSIQVA